MAPEASADNMASEGGGSNQDGPIPPAVSKFIKEYHSLSEEAKAALPQNPDKEETHTEWRKALYHTWSNVFWDVSRFLAEVNCTIGHWHPPSSRADEDKTYGELVVKHGQTLPKTWTHNILLVPAFLDHGVKVRFYRHPSNGEGPSDSDLNGQKLVGTWDASMEADVWYFRRDLATTIIVDSPEGGESQQGVAAVFVFANLCLKAREETDEKESPSQDSPDGGDAGSGREETQGEEAPQPTLPLENGTEIVTYGTSGSS